MIAILLPLAAMAGPFDGPVSKFDDQKPDFVGRVDASIYDVERCLLDIEDRTSPMVYRQPDRPNEVRLLWTNQFGITIDRVDLKVSGEGTDVRSWLTSKHAHPCYALRGDS